MNNLSVDDLLDEGIELAGSHHMLCGYLDVSTQQYYQFRSRGELTVPAALKLSHMTGRDWKLYCPEYAKKLEVLPQFNVVE